MADGGRVIAGTAAGRRLAPPGPATRPLADRVKQALFAILAPDLPGAIVLDLFAGGGGAGIEALSRGAARAVFVDRDGAAIRAVRENLRRTGLTDRAVVRQGDALTFLRSDAEAVGPFDLALVDPPYPEVELRDRALALLGQGRLLGPGAVVVAKHFWRDALPGRIGLLRSERVRRFGETALTLFRADPGADGAVAAVPQAPEAPDGAGEER